MDTLARIPILLLAIALERAVARARGLRVAPFTACVTSLGCALVQQSTSVIVRALVVGAYAWVHAHAAVLEIAMTMPAWVALAVLVDHQYYWWHRASHRIGIFWASHAVHHQSEHFDLTTALRQSALQGALASPVYWPLAVLGFPPLAFLAASTAVGIYQLWLHTRVIGRLPAPIEQWLNTPSHHRVHHGVDAKYVDRNYAGVLIVWDRLYGTFQAEEEEPRYGTARPFEGSNVLWANLVEWARMLELARGARRIRDKLYTLVAPPEWRPAGIACPDPEARARVEPVVPRAVAAIVSVQLVAIVAATSAWLAVADPPSGPALAAVALWISLVTVSWGGLLERRAWGRPLALVLAASMPLVVLAAGSAWPHR